MGPLSLLLALWALPAAAGPDCVAWMNRDRNAPESAVPGFKGYGQRQSFEADVRQVFDAVTSLPPSTDARLVYLKKAELPKDAGVFEQAACRAGAAANDANKTFFVCDALADIVADKADLVFVMAHELAHIRNGDATSSAKEGRDASADWNVSRGDAADYICGRVLEKVRGFERTADAEATEFVVKRRAELEKRLSIDNLNPDVGVSVVFKRKEFYYRQGIGEDKQHDTADQRAQHLKLAADRVTKALNLPNGF